MGEGTSGAYSTSGGRGGSGGADGGSGNGVGGLYGGGGGGSNSGSTTNDGVGGAVRIIWGAGSRTLPMGQFSRCNCQAAGYGLQETRMVLQPRRLSRS